MSIVIAFIVFFIGIVVAVIADISLIYPMMLGLVAFFAAALWQRFDPADVLRMALKGSKSTVQVISIFLLIGIMTGLWRSSGTVAFFVYYGIRFIPPQLFLLFSFLLPAGISYMMGSCFGTVSTVGVVLMILGQSSGIDTSLLCGAVLSGACVGDRMAPTSGCANLIAAVTKTKLSDILTKMIKSAAMPFALTTVFFGIMSFSEGGVQVDSSVSQEILQLFRVNLWLLIPAVMVLVLPLLKLTVRKAIIISIISAGAITIFVQKASITDMLHSAVYGYEAHGEGMFASVIGGGGVLSMVSVALMMMIAGGISGIFNGTRMLDGLEKAVSRLMNKIGNYPTAFLVSLFTNMAFCTQTISIIVSEQIIHEAYREHDIDDIALAIDIDNSNPTLGCMVPWNLSSSVPIIGMLGCSFAALPYCVYCYIQPLYPLLVCGIKGLLKKMKKSRKEC